MLGIGTDQDCKRGWKWNGREVASPDHRAMGGVRMFSECWIVTARAVQSPEGSVWMHRGIASGLKEAWIAGCVQILNEIQDETKETQKVAQAMAGDSLEVRILDVRQGQPRGSPDPSIALDP